MFGMPARQPGNASVDSAERGRGGRVAIWCADSNACIPSFRRPSQRVRPLAGPMTGSAKAARNDGDGVRTFREREIPCSDEKIPCSRKKIPCSFVLREFACNVLILLRELTPK
jgi:hypothetical protein